MTTERRTVAEIIASAAKDLGLIAGVDALDPEGEARLAFVLGVGPEDSPEQIADFLADPELTELWRCGRTASWLYGDLGDNATAVGPLPNKGLVRSVQSSLKRRRNTVFLIRHAGHDFTLFVRKRRAEIIQSWLGNFSVAKSVRDNKIFSSKRIVKLLRDLLSERKSWKAYRKLFDQDTPMSVHHQARLIDDEAIYETVRARMAANISACMMTIDKPTSRQSPQPRK